MVERCTIRLQPTKEQEEYMKRHADASRFVWNQLLANHRVNKNHTSGYDLMKEVSRLKENPGCEWLSNINKRTLQMAAVDLSTAFNRRNYKGYPKKKKRKTLSFPVSSGNKGAFYFQDYYTCHIDGIGRVRYTSDREMPTGSSQVFSDVRVSKSGGEWSASFGIGF